MAWAYYRDGVTPEPGPTRVESSGCLRCHRSVFSASFDEARMTKINHRHLYRQGFACMECHENAGHRPGVAARPRAVMEICMRCHEGDDRQSCALCHKGKASDVVSGRRLIQPVHLSMGGTCGGCHTQQLANQCIACHGGFEMPHSEAWKTGGHSYQGFVNQERCTLCHVEPKGVDPAPHGSPFGTYGGGFCNRCHSFPSPHGDHTTWIVRHGPVSEGAFIEQPVCNGCHGPGQVQKCDQCHQKEVCDRCHEERRRAEKP